MENVNKALSPGNLIIRGISTQTIGIALIVVVGGITIFNPVLGIMGALVFFLWVLVASRPILIVYGLTLMYPLTAGLSRGAVLPILRVAQAFLLLGFILFLLAKPGPLGKSRLTFIDLAFVFLLLTEAIFPILALYYRGETINLSNGNNIYGDSPLQVMLGPVQYYLLYRIIVATITSEEQIVMIVKLSFVTSIMVSIIGILERIVTSVRVFIQTYYPTIIQGPTTPIDELRITSTLGHFSGLASYLVFTLILVLACYTVGKQMKISLLLLAATTMFDSVALLLTGTFSGWIGMAVGIVILLILIRRIPKLFILSLIGIILAAFIFQSFLSTRLNAELGAGNAQGLVPQSFAYRIQLWQNLFLPAIGQNFVFGAGPAPAVLNYFSSEDSQYLYLLLRGGIFYFFSYLLLNGAGINNCWKQIKSKHRDASYPIAIALCVIFIVINVMNVSGEYFTYAGGTQTLWTVLAINVACGQLKVLNLPTIET